MTHLPTVHLRQLILDCRQTAAGKNRTAVSSLIPRAGFSRDIWAPDKRWAPSCRQWNVYGGERIGQRLQIKMFSLATWGNWQCLEKRTW